MSLELLWLLLPIWLIWWAIGKIREERSYEDRINSLRSQASPSMGLLTARYNASRSSRVSQHMTNLVNQAQQLHELELAPLRLEWERQLQQAQHDNNVIVAHAASQSKTDVNTYNQLKLIEGTAQVEVLKAQQLKDIEYEFLEKEHRLQIEGAMFLALKEQRELEGLMKMYEALVRKRHEIETGDDAPEVKQRLLERFDQNLGILDGVMNGRADRLLQEANGQDA